MSVFPRFVFPWALLLLAVVPWSIWVGARLRTLSRVRKWIAITLRTLILLCLIAALAGAELVRINDRLAVFFLLDHSNSIPEEKRTAAANAIRDMCDLFMTPRDEAGLVVFGREASIELSVGPKMELGRIQSFVDGEQTDLASAVRLAMAAFPQGYMRRIVVFSDGNETKGSAIEEVKLAQASGVDVNVVPLDIGGRSEVRIREVVTPTRINAGEPFKLQVVVRADQDCEGMLRIFQCVRGEKRVIQSAPVTLQRGDNAFLLPQELDASGFYEYEATIETAADTVMANNEGRSFSVIHGEPVVLLVDGDGDLGIPLEKALVSEGLQVIRIGSGELPGSLAQYQDFGAVVLANVSSTDLTMEQIRILEAMVRDLGIGLVMLGGPDAFGAGGYLNTAVERALPVDMDLKERKIMPRGALVVCLHTCEFDDGNYWARQISLAALNVLSPYDLMGATAYLSMGGDDWLFPLQPVGDKHAMRLALNTSQIGDMPSAQPGLQMAYRALKAADASVKRVVLISDGDPQGPSQGLLNSLKKEKIAVSTVCINPHSPSDQEMLRRVAERTGGEFYFVRNASRLPQIFTKEAAVVKRGLLVETPFTPKLQDRSEILGALDGGFPQLRGYVVTTPKDSATVAMVSDKDDPILAHWRYGLGKSVAFTSDATVRWAPTWLAWQGFNRFWAQTIRWALRDVSPSGFRVETRMRDGRGYVRIDATDEAGKFVNFLRPEGIVVGPGPDFERAEVDIMQTGPGIYEGTFPADARGVYMLNLTYERPDGSKGMIPAGLALGYSKEYDYNITNSALLEQIASTGGGRLLEPSDNPFEHTLKPTSSILPIWQSLAVLAMCLFLVEIFVRRVVVDFVVVFVWAAALLRKTPWLGRFVPQPRSRSAPLTGVYGTQATAAKNVIYAPSGEMDLDVGFSGPAEALGEQAGPAPTVDQPEKAPGHTDYTSQLLAAKDRALKKRHRRGREPEE